MATASATQRVEVRRAVAADNRDLAVHQERCGLDAAGDLDNSREVVDPVIAVTGEAADTGASRRTISRLPSCLISWTRASRTAFGIPFDGSMA